MNPSPSELAAYLELHLRFVPNQSGVERMAHCPRPKFHSNGDKTASCSVNIKEGLLCCHACGLEGSIPSLWEQLGWERPPWLSNGRSKSEEGLPAAFNRKPITRWHHYTDETGQVLYSKARIDSIDAEGRAQKEFAFWCQGSWALRGRKVGRVPYRLHKLAGAEEIHIAEGESDVEALEFIGLVATTNDAGAGKWPAEFAKHFKANQRLVVHRDNDQAGLEHQVRVLNSLISKVASLKAVHLERTKAKGDVRDWIEARKQDPVAAAEELARIVDGTPECRPDEKSSRAEDNPPLIDWKLWDANQVFAWPEEPFEWIVENLIARGGIGFMSGAPKDRKSLLALDLALHLTQSGMPRAWLGKFPCKNCKVLYVAREDPRRRVRDRLVEVCRSYGLAIPPETRLQFLIRERIHLTDPLHREWLNGQVRNHAFDFLVLDVLNRMIPDLDELSAKDMAKLVGILEELNRTLGVTILLLDHTRKPQGRDSGRNSQEPNPFDLKGSVAKYGAADFMLCVSRTKQPGRIQLYCENKDTDLSPHFLVDVSPKDSGQPKFSWAGDVDRLANDMKAVGEGNRQKVYDAIGASWMTREEIQTQVGLSRSAIANHLKSLVAERKIEPSGKNRQSRYRKPSVQDESVLWTEDQNS